MAGKKGEFILEFRAAELGHVLDQVAAKTLEQMQQAISEIATGAYANISAAAQHGLTSTRQDYLKGLNIDKLGNNEYLISLTGEWPNALESGFPSFDMRAKMLMSKKIVEVGPRAGQPWVQTAKDGHKFAHVPFEHQPFSKAPGAADLGAAIKALSAKNVQGALQGITKVFRDASGKAIDSGQGIDTRAVARVSDVSVLDNGSQGKFMSQLQGLVKYQRVTTNATGKETVSSIYHTYRTVSEIGKGFIHPGFKGLHAFDDAEKWVAEQIDAIIKSFLG